MSSAPSLSLNSLLIPNYTNKRLLYGTDVINWTQSELASISVAFNTAMCKIYKVKFCSLDDIYKYTGQSDVADTTVSRRRNFLYTAQHRLTVVVRNLATVML